MGTPTATAIPPASCTTVKVGGERVVGLGEVGVNEELGAGADVEEDVGVVAVGVGVGVGVGVTIVALSQTVGAQPFM